MGNTFSCICVKEDQARTNAGKEEGQGIIKVTKERPGRISSTTEKTNQHKGEKQSSNSKKGFERKVIPDTKGRNIKANKESSRTTSSESSDSSNKSDSSDQTRYKKSSIKSYKNKYGGTTIVSKVTNVRGNVMNISGDNIVLTMNNNTPARPDRKGDDEVTSYQPYTQTTKKNFPYYGKKFGSTSGGFLYRQEAAALRLEGIDITKLKLMCQESVCHIHYPGGSASGFVVGTSDKKYIFTARHVLVEIVKSEGHSVFESIDPTFAAVSKLGSPKVYCVFNHIKDDYIPADADKFHFKEVIHFEDAETDTAVLELKDNRYGTAFTIFSSPIPLVPFYFIGHPGGRKKVSCKSENMIDISDPVTSNHINKVRRWCNENRLLCDPSDHDRLDNPARLLFHVSEGFTKGASGCPGLVFTPPDGVSVVTVLLRGYPNDYYDHTIDTGIKDRVPKDFLVEQGANMFCVARNMRARNSNLHSEIFRFS